MGDDDGKGQGQILEQEEKVINIPRAGWLCIESYFVST